MKAEITSEEFYKDFVNTEVVKDYTIEEVIHDSKIAMIEFAKYHVEKALKEASTKAMLKLSNYKGDWHSSDPYPVDDYTTVEVDKESILNSYPLKTIKI